MHRQNLRRSRPGSGPREHKEDRLSDEARFIRNWLENPLVTGAVSPSGRALARAMAAYVDPTRSGPVIELGPGTGPVTEALVRRGIAPNRLVLIEYDAEFCKRLARRFPEARVIHGDAHALANVVRPMIDEPAVAVVSSLPLLVKSEVKRAALLDAAFDLMIDGGPFIQFTYAVVSPIPKKLAEMTSSPFTAEASPPIWLNLPPARVWVYRRQSDANRSRARGAVGA